MKWVDVLELHGRASSAFAETAAAIPPESWLEAKEGKWAPAQVTKHLSLAYEILLSELGGGAGMSIRTTFWQRALLRWTLVPRLLRGKPFPKGARAPKETRPEEITEGKADAIMQFQSLAKLFADAVQKAYSKDSGARLTHAYFGRSGLVNSVQFCARHIEHHTKAISEFRSRL